MTQQEQILELITQCHNTNDMQYREVLDTQFQFEQYYLKPMFKDKYTVAYVSALDDIELGTEDPIINISIYNTPSTLINLDMNFSQFKPIFRAVKDKIKLIEKVNQQLLTETSNLPALFISNPQEAMTRVQTIISTRHYENIIEE